MDQQANYENLTPRQQQVALKSFAAVRQDKVVGRGTCSVIDECYSQAELLQAIVELIAKGEARAPNGVVKQFRAQERLHAQLRADVRAEAF